MDIAGSYRSELEDGEIAENTRNTTCNAVSGQAVPNVPIAPDIPIAPVEQNIQNNDAPNIERIQLSDLSSVAATINPLDSKKKNWQTWSRSMSILFDIVYARGYINGTIRMPDQNLYPNATKIWRFNDAYIMMLITKNIAESEMIHTNDCENAYDMWNNLKKVHQLANFQIFTDKVRIFQNIRTKDGDNIKEHLIKLKTQWEHVQHFSDEQNRRQFNDSFFKVQIVVSLPRSWDSFTSNYVKPYVDTDPAQLDPQKWIDSQELIGIISQEYELQQSRKREEDRRPPKGETNRPSLADRMSSNNNKTTQSNGNNENGRSPRKKQCRQCGRLGHFTDQCHFLGQNKCRKCERFGHDFDNCPQSQSQNNQPSSSSQSSDGKRKTTGNTYYNNKRSRNEAQNAEAETGNSSISETVNVALHDQLVAFHTVEASDGLEDVMSDDDCIASTSTSAKNKYVHDLYDWLGDTGTTSHITHRRDAFVTYEPLPKLAVSGVGGMQSFAIARGTVYLQSECDGVIHILQLKNVLHIPNNANSLLSLGSWEEQTGRSIVIKNGKLTLLTKDGIAVARGIRLSNRLYQMSFALSKAPADADFSFNAQSHKPTWETWHLRFGHISYTCLLLLFLTRLADGFDVDLTSPRPDCVACTEAKLTVAPHGPSSKRLTKPGELTHVDLWGKYDKNSINGNKYYLLLVDDASRYTTVDFLKTKNQAAQHIKDYMTHQIARGKSPCAIRMDRGSEFVNEELRSWCHSKGIRYQTTAPYSPAQNGVAERMNRTLGELSRAMLTASKLREFLWEMAVAHDAYVRNMSFTKAVPSATPYEVWHGRRPNVAHLREFGAPVWVLAEGQRVLRKMLPKSHRRAYVGYDEGAKAVKYYNAETKTILTSRNYRFLVPSTSSPPEELLIEPGLNDPQ